MSNILSKQITLTLANTAYPLGTGAVNGDVFIKAPATNGGVVHLGNDGNDTVSATTGFSLAANTIIALYLGLLDKVYACSTVAGDKVEILFIDAQGK